MSSLSQQIFAKQIDEKKVCNKKRKHNRNQTLKPHPFVSLKKNYQNIHFSSYD